MAGTDKGVLISRMSRLKKIGLILLALVVLVIVLLAVVVPQFIDPEDVRDAITQAATEQTGRDVKIEGELSLRTFPCCSIRMADASVSNPPVIEGDGFASDDFVRIGSIDLGIRLWPLLTSGTVAADEIILEDLKLNLQIQADGRDNWTFTTAEPEVQSEATQEEVVETDLSALSVAGITVRNAQVRYLDEVESADITATVLSLETGAIEAGEPFDISGQFAVDDRSTNTQIALQLAAAVNVNDDASEILLDDLDVTTTVTSPDVPGNELKLKAVAEVLQYIVASEQAILNKGVIELQVAGLDISATADGSFFADRYDASGSVQIASFAPKALLNTLGEPPLETADPNVLESADVQLDWQLDNQLLLVDSLLVQFDDSKLTGKAQLSALDQSDIRFEFNLDQMNADRYLPPESESSGESAGQSESTDTEIPVDLLRDLDLAGSFGIGQLTVAGLSLQNLKFNVSAKDGVVVMDPASANLYGGQYAGSMRLDAVSNTPTVRFSQSLKNIQAEGLLTDLNDMDNIKGLLQADIDGSSRGKTTDVMTQALKTDVSFQLSDGVYEGVDLWYEIRKAWSLVKKKTSPEASAEPKTDIGALDFVGQLEDGLLTSKTMKIEAPFLRIDGSGTAKVFEETMDFVFDANVYETPTFEDGEDLSGLRNITIPVKLRGPFESPSVKVDLTSVAKDVAVDKLRDRIYKKLGGDDEDASGENNVDGDQNEAKDSNSDVLKKGLKDLFGR